MKTKPGSHSPDLYLAGLAGGELEVLGIGEERRRSTGVQKDNGLIFTDSFAADVIDETGHRLARVDRIKDNPFGPPASQIYRPPPRFGGTSWTVSRHQ